MTWQPIDTAPKDVHVLLFCPKDNQKINVAAFKKYKGFNGCWTSIDIDGFFEPTHWMPLPDALKVEE